MCVKGSYRGLQAIGGLDRGLQGGDIGVYIVLWS